MAGNVSRAFSGALLVAGSPRYRRVDAHWRSFRVTTAHGSCLGGFQRTRPHRWGRVDTTFCSIRSAHRPKPGGDMSGIVAVVNREGAPVEPEFIRRLTESLRFRGPDR